MQNKLKQEQIDALKEIVSIGAGNAATALSQMLKRKTNILVPKVTLAPIDKVALVFGGAELLVTAVYLQVLGDVSGVILFSFHKDDATRFADLLLGQSLGKTKVLNEIARSALKEASTILTGAYLSALAKLLNMRLLISSPALAQDMAGAIVNNILAETSKEGDYSIVIDSEFEIVDQKVMAYFFFIPDKESLDKILKAMNVG
ncbi:chemotaxis protein CheC [Patescibacteria group bacterium]|nr:chemotaxis protein CheC [Patescibacteria group bacterium]